MIGINQFRSDAGATSRRAALSLGYTLEVTAFIAVFVALGIGFAFGRYRTHTLSEPK